MGGTFECTYISSLLCISLKGPSSVAKGTKTIKKTQLNKANMSCFTEQFNHMSKDQKYLLMSCLVTLLIIHRG